MKKYSYTVQEDADDAPAKVLRAIGANKRVLEIGCASGVQTRVMKERLGCTVTGIEIDPDAAKEAAPYCESVIVGDLEKLDFATALGDRRFDVITIADVLEHLRQPERVLPQLKPFLAPGGFILASIPNVVHAGLILDMARGRFDYRPYGLLDDTHVRFFTLKSVCRLFENAGLRIDHLDRVVRPAEASEFVTPESLSPEESQILEFIRAQNPESDTYQFIVHAQPAAGAATTFKEVEQGERIRDLETQVGTLRTSLRKSQSELSWLQSRPIFKFTAALRSLLGGSKQASAS